MRRFVLPQRPIGNDPVVLSGGDFHYLIRVRRLAVGDGFAAIDRDGTEYTCTIRAITGASCEIALANAPPALSESTPAEPRITLFQCLAKAGKLDQIVRQATECGVSELVPVRSRFSVAELPEDRVDRRLDRWRRIAREAVQQSGAERPPSILPPIRIDELPDFWGERGPALLFHEDCLESSRFLDTLCVVPTDIAICIGPEGGFAPDEVEMLLGEHFIPVWLGRRVLRSETAAIYAIAAVQISAHLIAQTVNPE